jgi:hypothetical protein
LPFTVNIGASAGILLISFCRMTPAHKIEAWIAVIVVIVAGAGTFALVHWHAPRPISLSGAVLVQSTDPHKQRPVADVDVSAGDLALADARSDASGLFTLHLRRPIRRGYPIVLSFRDPQYRPLDVKDFVSDRLYVVHLTPVVKTAADDNQPRVKVTNVRVRYTVKSMSEVNVGGEVKTFEIQNKGNVPCNSHNPCSPDGRWKANVGSVSLDAGASNVFRDVRASCIAGPCPFTKIENDQPLPGAHNITVSALDWSDTATFLVEAEVFRSMMSALEHWSYPVIFGDGLSFTLPSSAESVSIEADMDGQTIIFPVGPSLFLSWATCETVLNPDKGRVFRCAPKPGYQFQ